jgi:mRNA interferase RelE/StbE
MYRVQLLKEATRDLAKMDKSAGRRIIDRINWLADNLDDVKPEILSGDLSEFHKLRVGSYRVVYEILRDEQLIVIHQIGHRREIYRRR